MESGMKRRKNKWLVYITLCVCVCVFSANVVNCTDLSAIEDNEEVLPPEDLIDDEINNIDNPKKTSSYGSYIVGKIVDTLTAMSTKSFTSLPNKNELRRLQSVMYTNDSTMYGNNSVWESLFKECSAKTSLTCVKKTVFGYLDKTMDTDGDLEVTDSLIFIRNGNELVENKYDERLNSDHGKNFTIEASTTVENTTNESEVTEGRSYSTFYTLTNALYDKGVKFIMTHDLEFQLPDMLFDGATVKISPKALEEDGGALLKLEVNNRKDSGEGRILFKKHKKKLLMAFFALLMVVKMIKVKLMFILPVLLGVGTAKKLFLKLLLFLFPAFAHIFKFCAYYHAHHTKYHHHHHQVAHHHHHVPVHVPVPVHVDHSHTVHVDPPPPPPDSYGPPTSYGPQSSYGPPPSGPPGPSSHGGGWESSAPGWARNEYLSQAQENELESWGLMSKGAYHIPAGGVHPSQSLTYNSYPPLLEDPRISRGALSVTEATRLFLPQPQQTPVRYQPNNMTPPPLQVSAQVYNNQQKQLLALHQQKHQLQNVQAVQQHNMIQVSGPGAMGGTQSNIAHHQTKVHQQQLQVQNQKQQQLLLERQKQQLLKQQQQTLKLKPVTPKPPVEGTTIPVTYDPFYSPILQRMDNVFVQLGFNEEACRERLVCSMYKTPSRFSPHSNLISAELSRDPRELQKPAVPNSASVRFHRYVQAARDGQDRKDCLRLYPACTVKTE